jgi:hypothetical protein
MYRPYGLISIELATLKFEERPHEARARIEEALIQARRQGRLEGAREAIEAYDRWVEFGSTTTQPTVESVARVLEERDAKGEVER